MTAYATQQDLVDRFGNAEMLAIGDRDQDQVIDVTVVTGALDDASALIDTYLGKRYDLPLAATPPALVPIAAALARHALYAANPPEDVRAAHDDALRFLRDLAAGKAVLDIAGSEPASAVGKALTSAPDRVFTSESLNDL